MCRACFRVTNYPPKKKEAFEREKEIKDGNTFVFFFLVNDENIYLNERERVFLSLICTIKHFLFKKIQLIYFILDCDRVFLFSLFLS